MIKNRETGGSGDSIEEVPHEEKTTPEQPPTLKDIVRAIHTIYARVHSGMISRESRISYMNMLEEALQRDDLTLEIRTRATYCLSALKGTEPTG